LQLHHDWDTSIVAQQVQRQLLRVLESKTSYHGDGVFIGYYNTDPRTESVLYTNRNPESAVQEDILKLFAANITLIFQNLAARENIQETQTELLLILGGAIEQRSKETGAHGRRAARMCKVTGLR